MRWLDGAAKKGNSIISCMQISVNVYALWQDRLYTYMNYRGCYTQAMSI